MNNKSEVHQGKLLYGGFLYIKIKNIYLVWVDMMFKNIREYYSIISINLFSITVHYKWESYDGRSHGNSVEVYPHLGWIIEWGLDFIYWILYPYKIDYISNSYKNDEEIKEWLKALNITHTFKSPYYDDVKCYYKICFRFRNDLVLYKLTWGGTR